MFHEIDRLEVWRQDGSSAYCSWNILGQVGFLDGHGSPVIVRYSRMNRVVIQAAQKAHILFCTFLARLSIRELLLLRGSRKAPFVFTQ
jgi:hypothetical protein